MVGILTGTARPAGGDLVLAILFLSGMFHVLQWNVKVLREHFFYAEEDSACAPDAC